ncbi:MAG: hypothetical protein WCA00_08660 [Candidatus Acidiferrales bacterium]
MKTASTLLALVLLGHPFLSFYQTVSTPEEVIARSLETGALDGHTIKMAGRMGDASAVAVTRVVADRPLRPEEIQSVLGILTESFADPRLVENPADREPRIALFVLRYLDATTTDTSMRAQIAETLRYILDHFSKYQASEASSTPPK